MSLKGKPSFHYEISFPDFAPSIAIKSDIERYLTKLETLFNRIVSCQIVVRSPHKHRRKHNYHIHILLELPGQDVVISHDSEKDDSHIDVHIAIRDAFKTLYRSLRKKTEKLNKKTFAKKTLSSQEAVVKSSEFL